jgi:hypothetical protein
MPNGELAEVMVRDQINHKTREIAVELSRGALRVFLSGAGAAHLDGVTEYTVPLAATEVELHDPGTALSAIFDGGQRGRYASRLDRLGNYARPVPSGVGGVSGGSSSRAQAMAFLISLMVSADSRPCLRPRRTVGSDAMPWRLAAEPFSRNRVFGNLTS